MSQSVTDDRGRSIVALEGEIDLDSSPEARATLLEQVGTGRPVLVDMAGVSYIDSSGVASLVEAFQLARKQGSEFGLVHVSDAALRVLQLARLETVFEIHESLDAALGADSQP